MNQWAGHDEAFIEVKRQRQLALPLLVYLCVCARTNTHTYIYCTPRDDTTALYQIYIRRAEGEFSQRWMYRGNKIEEEEERYEKK